MKNVQKTQPQIEVFEKMAWLRLARTENVGPVTFHRLLERYGTASKALEALPELAARGGRRKPLAVPPLAAIEREYESLRKIGGDVITAAEDSYPMPLAATEDAPPVISVLGNASSLKKTGIGIVGARNASLNGRKFAESLARDLGAAGHAIVSGLARGVDTAAHQGSLETGTVAVVAGGVDVVYPPENQSLYERIREHGCIVAESPFGVAPVAQSFPRRNRIISGLSAGIIVVEATLRSGSLITARLAAEQGRDVYAVPGHPLDPRAEGPNTLIRDGATLARNAADVLEHLSGFTGGNSYHMSDSGRNVYKGESAAPPLAQADATHVHQEVQRCLSPTPVSIDEIVRATGLGVSAVLGALLEMELAGAVLRLPGNRVSLTI
ncbi:MAG TPA: DNA-processing protein DprA [Patescibacteria group bacterium]|nr:DNA-processing protein DprA [Patescibacteria group bacterium]